ncbi:MAG: FGGY family carbohydrate kinase [Ferrimicrobium sp.]
MIIAVLDIGSSSVRASAVDERLSLLVQLESPYYTDRPTPTSATFDANSLARTTRSLLKRLVSALDEPLQAIAITNQRASSVLFDPATRHAYAPGLSWEDLRTAPECLAARMKGTPVAPNESATKFRYLLDHAGDPLPESIRVGTIDSWIVSYLTDESTVATDGTNAAVTGLTDLSGVRWDPALCEVFSLRPERLPSILPNHHHRGMVTVGGNRIPVIVTIADQQASLLGQGGQRDTRIKLTLGTSGVADRHLLEPTPRYLRRGPNGTFPILVEHGNPAPSFGLEAFMFNAGSAITWLASLGVLGDVTETATRARNANPKHTPTVVPALSGLGAPRWDFGARAVISHITPATGPDELIRGTLLGVVFGAVELIEALITDSALGAEAIYIDGKVTNNDLVAQALADTMAIPVLKSTSPEATTIGAALLALQGLGYDPTIPDATVTLPEANEALLEERYRWRNAIQIAGHTIPALSAVSF